MNFSFSGLKTAVLQQLQKVPLTGDTQLLADYAASFQAAVCELLVHKTAAAVESTGIRRVVVAGGVACNSGLRREFALLADRMGIELFFPSPAYCADNAAMIAVPGDFYLNSGLLSGFDFDALPVWPLDTLASRLG